MKVSLLNMQGTMSELVKELKEELVTLPCHIFEAVWQQKQFSDVVDAPPASTAVIVMDFAKNFKCEMQREVQSAHWYAQQITLHPCIAFYPCDTCNL